MHDSQVQSWQDQAAQLQSLRVFCLLTYDGVLRSSCYKPEELRTEEMVLRIIENLEMNVRFARGEI